MPDPDFIAGNSRFFENLLEHRFLHDLSSRLVTQHPPRLLNVLKAEVDQFGFDLVLSVGGITRHVQMKTRSGNPAPNPYEISESLWALQSACVIWMRYDQASLEPIGYYLMGPGLPSRDQFKISDRGFRLVKMQRAAHHDLDIPQLAALLFGKADDRKAAFFFGSGISYPSKADSVGAITEHLLNGTWRWVTEGRYVSANKSDAPDLRVQNLQGFIRCVHDYIAPRLGDRPAGECNYEDLYAVLSELREHVKNNVPNPLFDEAAKALVAASADFVAFYADSKIEPPFAALCADAMKLVQWVVYFRLSDIPQRKGLEPVAAVAGAPQVRELDIFTLNHDLLVEQELEAADIKLAHGFGKQGPRYREFDGTWVPNGKPVRVLKLHGSLNWFLGDFKTYGQYVSAESDAYHLLAENGDQVNLLRDWMPLFLTGTRAKEDTYGLDLIGEIFAKFREFSSNHRTIIFSGYGWRDHGINERLLQWVYDTPTNKMVILEQGGTETLLKVPFWAKRQTLLFDHQHVKVIPKFLCACTLDELKEYFDPIPF